MPRYRVRYHRRVTRKNWRHGGVGIIHGVDQADVHRKMMRLKKIPDDIESVLGFKARQKQSRYKRK